MKTSGYKDYRIIPETPYNELERKALEIFNRDHANGMSSIVFGTTNGIRPQKYLTPEEEKIVLGVIQWLGTSVGYCFVHELTEERKKLIK